MPGAEQFVWLKAYASDYAKAYALRILSLRTRSSRAFNAELRAKLADACQVVASQHGLRVFPYNLLPTRAWRYADSCCCPLGAAARVFLWPEPCQRYPYAETEQEQSFISAFNVGSDDGTAEAALGLRYRLRYAPVEVRRREMGRMLSESRECEKAVRSMLRLAQC